MPGGDSIDFTFTDFLDAHDKLNMTVGSGPQACTVAEGIAKLDERFHSMLQNLECRPETMGRLGELGCRTLQNLHTLGDDRAMIRQFLLDGLGLDPTKGFEHTMEAGKIVSAWEQVGIRVQVDNKREAERLSQNLPPQLTGEDVLLLKKQFEKHHNKGREIDKSQVPSKTYLELKVGHVQTRWEAEKLSDVTSLAQAERHALRNANMKTMSLDETACSFQITSKPFSVPMPMGSEALRARLELVRNTHMFLKLKFPNKGVLATCELATWDFYIKWLFGKDVWGFTTKGENGEPSACPHQGIVMSFDLACREKVATLMSEGTDIDAAFDLAMADSQLKLTTFLSTFTIEAGSSRCRALSAPAFQDIHGNGGSASGKRPRLAIEDGDAEAPLSKNQKKARARKAKASKGQAKGGGRGGGKALAIMDVQAPPNAHAATRPPKGKGSGKQTLPKETPGGEQICFAWNNNQKCKQNPCRWKHVCQLCFEADHPKGLCKQSA